MRSTAPGQVIGTAGGTLEVGRNEWAANADVARIGRAGELRTAQVLADLAARPGGPTVLHDLTIPGSRANIDHVVVSGRRVTLLDSKVWKPATYWRLAGRTFRGRERFPYADKQTMSMAVDRIVKHLSQAGCAVDVGVPLTVVWPSHDGKVRMVVIGRRGTRIVPGADLARHARRLGTSSADPNVVAALVPLVAGARRTPGTPRHTRSR